LYGNAKSGLGHILMVNGAWGSDRLKAIRHCERSEAIQSSRKPLWIASLRSQ
jgi:hypothetical protein